MFSEIAKLIDINTVEIIDKVANKVGLGSIVTTVGVTQTQDLHAGEALVSELMTSPAWGLADYALCVSLIGGVLFAIEKAVMIYIRYKQVKKDED